MKQLTQAEFDSLGDGPHSALEVGVPPEDEHILLWATYNEEWSGVYYLSGDMWIGGGCPSLVVDDPIWHKLPADFEGDE